MADRGRPSSYTQEIADAICERLASGQSLRAVCRDEGMPAECTVRRWALDDVNGFSTQYARARELQMDAMADEILVIADDGTGDSWTDDDGVVRTNHDVIARSKLRVDTRKWLMSKLAPKKYGDAPVSSDDAAKPPTILNVKRAGSEL